MSKILFIVEGVKTELGYAQSVDSFINELLKEKSRNELIVIESYGTLIYDLYKKLTNLDNPEEFDTLPLLQEILINRFPDKDFDYLDDVDDFPEIFLFFDLDAHHYKKFEHNIAIKKVKDQISHMLTIFNDSTDKGKLFISYPMVESIKCFSNSFIDYENKNATVTYYPVFSQLHFKDFAKNFCKINPMYNKRPYKHEEMLNLVLYFTLCSRLLLGEMGTPDYNALADSQIIFEKQYNLILNNNESIILLNAFPQFILYFFGVKKLYDDYYPEYQNILHNDWIYLESTYI